MEFNDEQLAKITEYAGLFLTCDDIATLLEVDPADFRQALRDEKHPAAKAYRMGQVQSKLALRRPVIKMAGHGSPQAELLADKYISEQHLSEIDD